MKKHILLIPLILISLLGNSQCAANEAEVSIVVHTDDYGYEGYWQLLPTGNACGEGMIAEGGSLAVGCDGAGNQVQNQAEGYANNLTTTEGSWCLLEGVTYDLIYVDDWGDGGFSFDIIVNGFQVATFDGVGLGATFNFTVEEPSEYDMTVTGSNLYSYVTTGLYDLEVHVFNNGTATVNSYDLNYTVNNGGTQTQNITSTSISNYETEDVDHEIPINIATEGVYTIKIWADNINGNSDQNNLNDTLIKQIEAGPGTPNYIDFYIDGASGTTITQIAGSSDQISKPTDLDFHPVLSNKELWVINRGTEDSGGSTVTISNAGESNQSATYKQDGNAWHFMSLPTGMAFSSNGNWASSPGVYDANHNGGEAFTGPTLWSSDLSVYAEPSGGNGSHLDMLHASPQCQGIASEKDNVFWVFDGYNNDLVRYDFVSDHGPGNSDHGDGIIRRYSIDQLEKDPDDNIVSHLVLDAQLQWLYAVDHGNNRVIRIDITSGTEGGTPAYTPNEDVSEYSNYQNYTHEEVITGLNKPAGIDVIEDRMLVSEYESGLIKIFDISVVPAIELGVIETGLSSLQGIKIGPDGHIWFVDNSSNGVYRVDLEGVGVTEITSTEVSVYPNPSQGKINIQTKETINGQIEIKSIQGKLVYSSTINSNFESITLDLESGVYFVNIMNNNSLISSEKLIIE